MTSKLTVCFVVALVAFLFAQLSAVTVPDAISKIGLLREWKSPHLCMDGKDQMSGYFSIDETTSKNYFYWFFPSQNNPATDPVVLWLTGGPGCSGELALFMENGPCIFNNTKGGVEINPYSWNAKASVIYVDQPAGTGFSYSDDAGYDSDEAGVAKDLNTFLRTFFTKHADLAANDFYIFGESYGGHYVPATAWFVQSQNEMGAKPNVNLKGIGIGNGLTNPLVQEAYYPEMIYNYTAQKLGSPLVSLDTYSQMMSDLPGCLDLIRKCYGGDDSSCGEAQYACSSSLVTPYVNTGRNVYDIRRPCDNPPLCYDFSALTNYLNDPAVQRAIGVSRPWNACNRDVTSRFGNDYMKGYQVHIPDLLHRGIRVLIYAGDCDYICNWIGNYHWTMALDWEGKNDYAGATEYPFFVPGIKTAVATVRTARGFTFMKVLDAGHMVPMDQPYVAQMLLNDFLAFKPEL